VFDIDDFVNDCRQAITDDEPRSAIKDVLQRAVSSPNRVNAVLTPERAEVVPLHASADLTVLKVVWAPGMRFQPHNHLMWAAIGIYSGQEDNTFYRRTGTGIIESGGRELCLSDVAVLGENTIHAVSNPRKTFTAAIHVYAGDLTMQTGRSQWDDFTLEEEPYDFEQTKVVFEAANAALTRPL
jgi:predicted metal-dependent enzyme (double-stranded beta helix superfamily)